MEILAASVCLLIEPIKTLANQSEDFFHFGNLSKFSCEFQLPRPSVHPSVRALSSGLLVVLFSAIVGFLLALAILALDEIGHDPTLRTQMLF